MNRNCENSEAFVKEVTSLLSTDNEFVILRQMQDTSLHFFAINNNEVSDKFFVLAPFDTKQKILRLNITEDIQGSPESISAFIQSKYHNHSGTNKIFTPEQDVSVKAHNRMLEKCRDLNKKAHSVYKKAFAKFKAELTAGHFAKLVLSRPYFCLPSHPLGQSFLDLCKKYPNAFCYLVKIRDRGIFMGASPEVLAQINGKDLHTMSLAGTMVKQADGQYEWSAKNIKEQQIVTDYIIAKLTPFADRITISGPVTHDAGPVVHLLTQITAALKNNTDSIDAISNLHPTPAVCGIPDNQAINFILENEGYDREFYAGYVGIVTKDSLKIYVNLRCLALKNDLAVLYAGGGLLVNSDLDEEWQETENKLNTLRDLI